MRSSLLWTLTSAVAWGFCFQKTSLPLLAAVALVPWLANLQQGRFARTAFLGWLHGIVFWALTIPWITTTLVTYGGLPKWMALICWAALLGYLALYSAAFAVATSWLIRRSGLTLIWVAPPVWVLSEWLRGVMLTGFPWNLAAYAWTDSRGALALAPVLGALGVSGVLLFTNAAFSQLVHSVLTREGKRQVGRLCVPVALVLALFVALPRFQDQPDVGADGDRVLVVQAGGSLEPESTQEIFADYQRLLDLSTCPAPGTLVVWPESAAFPLNFFRDVRLQQDIAEIAQRGCAVLLNAARREEERLFNSAMIVSSSGMSNYYDKTHLVPFGEYVPLAELFPFLGQIARAAGAFSPGEGLTLLDWRGGQIGLSVCFEIIFPTEVAERVRAGAGWIVTLTNDAWYGDSSAPRQHLRAARFRAAETRRAVVRAALTGISAVISPDGSVDERVDLLTHGVIDRAVVPRDEITFFVRLPWLVPAACLVFVMAAVLFARPNGRRHQGGAGIQTSRQDDRRK